MDALCILITCVYVPTTISTSNYMYLPCCWGYSIDHEIDSLCGSKLYSLTQYMHELCNYRKGGGEERERERERNGSVISDC